MSKSLFKRIVWVVAATLLATPLFAYTIWLKDGTSILAKKIYRTEGDLIIITTPSGTETSYPLEKVDIERTREYNANNLDGAMLLENGELTGIPTQKPTTKRKRLGDLIAGDQARIQVRQPVKRPQAVDTSGPARSAAGYLDLNALPRQAYGDLEIMGELRSYFTSQGLEARVFNGTQGTHPLIEILTSSESAVFKSLEVAAQALPQMQDRHASRIAALELVLRSPRGNAAGQFVITPELADELNSGQTEASAFFVRYVQF